MSALRRSSAQAGDKLAQIVRPAQILRPVRSAARGRAALVLAPPRVTSEAPTPRCGELGKDGNADLGQRQPGDRARGLGAHRQPGYAAIDKAADNAPDLRQRPGDARGKFLDRAVDQDQREGALLELADVADILD